MTEKTRPFLTEDDILSTVNRMAEEIRHWADPWGGLTLISVLEGARPFTRDLVAILERQRGFKVAVKEVQVLGTHGTHLRKDRLIKGGLPSPDPADPTPLLLVDDLVDSGQTLSLLQQQLETLYHRKVRSAVLLRKFKGVGGPVDFCGFDLGWSKESLAQEGFKDRWLYGYGMDLNGHQRELRNIKTFDIR